MSDDYDYDSLPPFPLDLMFETFFGGGPAEFL